MPAITYASWEGTLRYVNEATYSVIPTTVAGSWVGIVESFEPTYAQNIIGIRGVGKRDLYSVQKGREEAEVRFEYIMQNTTFLTAQNLFDSAITGSFTLESEYLSGSGTAAHPTEYIYASGSKIDSATIASRVGEPVRATVTALGRNIRTGSARLLTSGNDNPGTSPYMYWNGRADRSATADGARVQITNISEFTFTVRNNLERVYSIDGSTQLRALPEKGRDIEGEITTTFDDFDEFATLTGMSSVSLFFTLTSGITGSLYDCKFSRGSLPTRSTDLISIRLPFTATSGSF